MRRLHFAVSVKFLTNESNRIAKILEQLGQPGRQRVDEQVRHPLRRELHPALGPIGGHADGPPAVHPQEEFDVRGELHRRALPDEITVKLIDHLIVIVDQVVLLLAGERLGKEFLLQGHELELFQQRFSERQADPHLLEGSLGQFVEIPVDQVVFVLEVAVKSGARSVAQLGDLRHCDLFQGLGLHKALHGLRQLIPGLL